ncbi:hypothetical protein CES86_5307 [Brucella lupini]|uniref:Uncharacterized protein n=1 Tax=Brucella lupini TaxID=255457 RepID=A0A256H0V8_9HYPH|nr:hypothetical protein CES86_5307 [Brucella lupini]
MLAESSGSVTPHFLFSSEGQKHLNGLRFAFEMLKHDLPSGSNSTPLSR